jgi:hypothetical protein
VFGGRVLRKIFRPKREQVKGDQRKAHNEELYDFLLLTECYSSNQVKKNEYSRACSMHDGEERCIQGVGGET